MNDALTDELHTLATTARQRLVEGTAQLRDAYQGRPQTSILLKGRARLVDHELVRLWTASAMPASAALVAVGGYGRGELFPASDVDLLVLLSTPPDEALKARLSALVGALWDCGLEVGHAVRTVDECMIAAADDITVQTNLLEARLLAGDPALFAELSARYREALDVRAFYKAKLLEQEQRYARFNDTPYALEPNCKESPGGLRDLQMLGWIARAAGLGHSWRDLARHRLITGSEAGELRAIERFLQHIRIRLHHLTGRAEDRLLFDHQEKLARILGIEATPTRRASEVLMQRYYVTAKMVMQLNTVLLQNYGSVIFPDRGAAIVVNARFQVVRELLDIRDEDVFERHPSALLECFLLLQQRSELKGMTARTLRALWIHRNQVNAAFRADPAHRVLFLQILQQRRGIVRVFRKMNEYGILSRYIPAWRRIVGQMQHDLFHVYTVDEHILMVIRNLRRFTEAQHAHEYPLCSRLIADVARKEVLYLAGLFHDIAKGRGGDHSMLGAREAKRFCLAHGMPRPDAETVGWLVQQHLTMSSTAQKSDLSDPDVIAAFARTVGSDERLVLLYLLTVADIRGTSPKVWNAWKAQLLEDLFHATRRVLAGADADRTLVDSLALRQEEARRLLRLHAVPEAGEQALWRHLDTPYFQRHTAEEIAWHARNLCWRVNRPEPVVKARLVRTGGGLQVLAYLPDRKALFARICGYFGRAGLSIVDAKVHTTRHGYALDTFVVQNSRDQDAGSRETVARIEHDLAEALRSDAALEPPAPGRVPRQQRHFPLTPEVRIFPDDKGTSYILEVVAGDRAGLLARIAWVLANANVNVASAKINTLGERAEDVFLIDGARLHDEQALLRLETALYDELRI